MKISKINNIDNKNLKTEATLLLNGILVGIFAGIVGASYRLLIGLSEKRFYKNRLYLESYFINCPYFTWTDFWIFTKKRTNG